MKSERRHIPVQMENVRLEDGFWSGRTEMIASEVIPYQWDALNDNIPGAVQSHAVENFRIAAGEKAGRFAGEFFQDSDLAKWIEAAAFSLVNHPDPTLEEKVDEVVELIGKAQLEDGYVNTYFTLAEPGKRLTNLRDKHELYCAGHLIEAAVAYHQATGKRNFLDIMCRNADFIASVFGTEPGKKRGYDGHEEIELALVKLYRATGKRGYLDLAAYFINERGTEPYYFDIEARERLENISSGERPVYETHARRAYLQAHLPVREQAEAVGHAVRLTYLCCGMMDVALETGDTSLADACKRLWESVTRRRIYITGGIGSIAHGEAFTTDYDLPNRSAYAETCAAIGMVFWAHRMLQYEQDSRYSDVSERALYNGVLSGISLDGKRYFYVNPLEVWPEEAKARHDLEHVKTERVPWYGCACCPPNVARLLASIGQYVYTQSDDAVFVHLYIASTAEIKLGGRKTTLVQRGSYPWDGEVSISFGHKSPMEFTLALRLPGWCRNPAVKINNEEVDLKANTDMNADAAMNARTEKGYLMLRRVWHENDTVQLSLPMEIERIQSNPLVRENAGRVALQRGPLVYCLEETDNGANLRDISLPASAKLEAVFVKDLLPGGAVVLEGTGLRTDPSLWEGKLYQPCSRENSSARLPAKLLAVPYSCWGNRKTGEMLVWIRQE